MRTYWRAWSEYNEKMGSVIMIDFEEGEALIELELDDGSKARHFDDLANIYLMQNTGIKDIHGNDIYEGDILSVDEYYQHSNGGQEYEVVEWNELYTGFFPLSNDYVRPSELIVIGNIYDNRDLIQGDAIDGRNE